MLSSQSAFLATSSTSFLSWAPGDGDTYKWKPPPLPPTHTRAHTVISFFLSPLLMPNRRALDFSIWDGTGYIWTTMNHCLFNETLMPGHKFLSCLQLTITEQQHTWSGRRHHSGCRSRYQELKERLTGSLLGSHCLQWPQESLEVEVECLWPSGCLLGHPAMGFCL